MTNNNSDIALWEAFKTGDRESLGLLFRRYYEHLFQYGSKFTQNKEILEDCIQELFIDIWQSKSQTEVVSVKAYLFKALKYKLFRLLQKNITTSINEDSQEALFELSHEIFIIRREESDATKAKISNALSQLTERQKEIIYLKFYLQLSYEEISEVMNINYQVSRNLLYQAIKSMKKLMLFAPFFIGLC